MSRVRASSSAVTGGLYRSRRPSRRDGRGATRADAARARGVTMRRRRSAEVGRGAHPGLGSSLRLQDLGGDIQEAAALVAGTFAQLAERLVEGDSFTLRECALGLLEHDAAVESTLQLLGQRLGAGDATLLEDRDGGDVGEGLHHADVVGFETQALGAEDVERTDGFGPQAHREGVDRLKAGRPRTRRERGPRDSACPRSALTTGSWSRKQSRQGPSSAWSWKSSRARPGSFEAAMNCNVPR